MAAGLAIAAVLWGMVPGVDARECPRGTAERLPIRILETPRFEADATYFAEGSEVYRVSVSVSICHDDLQFVKKGDRFLARYEVTVMIEDRRSRVGSASIRVWFFCRVPPRLCGAGQGTELPAPSCWGPSVLQNDVSLTRGI